MDLLLVYIAIIGSEKDNGKDKISQTVEVEKDCVVKK